MPNDVNLNAREPAVSIGMFVYYGERYLRQTLDNLLSQTFKDLELIVSDNASTDATAEICREFADRDPRVRHVRLKRNVGSQRNANLVFSLARGRYFMWASDHDVHDCTLIARCVDVLERETSVVLCYSRAAFIDKHGGFISD